jgi:hypothetical protein
VQRKNATGQKEKNDIFLHSIIKNRADENKMMLDVFFAYFFNQ